MRELSDARRAADDGDHITGDELRTRFTSPRPVPALRTLTH
jgi:hypothetical protein